MIFINDTWFYPTIISLIIGLCVVGAIIITKAKRKKKSQPPAIDFETLVISLGGTLNILDLSLEHQRLKVKVTDLKKVDQTLLKQLNIPAFLKGKELTLLIKHHPKEVLSYLSERRKEVN